MFLLSASCPIFFKMRFKLWMMKSWKDSLVGSTLRENFESSIIGGKLKYLINKAHHADNACMHATTAVDHEVSTATLQANLKGVILLAGTDVAFLGIVKDECQQHCDAHAW